MLTSDGDTATTEHFFLLSSFSSSSSDDAEAVVDEDEEEVEEEVEGAWVAISPAGVGCPLTNVLTSFFSTHSLGGSPSPAPTLILKHFFLHTPTPCLSHPPTPSSSLTPFLSYAAKGSSVPVRHALAKGMHNIQRGLNEARASEDKTRVSLLAERLGRLEGARCGNGALPEPLARSSIDDSSKEHVLHNSACMHTLTPLRQEATLSSVRLKRALLVPQPLLQHQ